jgi:hypothetical protein
MPWGRRLHNLYISTNPKRSKRPFVQGKYFHFDLVAVIVDSGTIDHRSARGPTQQKRPSFRGNHVTPRDDRSNFGRNTISAQTVLASGAGHESLFVQQATNIYINWPITSHPSGDAPGGHRLVHTDRTVSGAKFEQTYCHV